MILGLHKREKHKYSKYRSYFRFSHNFTQRLYLPKLSLVFIDMPSYPHVLCLERSNYVYENQSEVVTWLQRLPALFHHRIFFVSSFCHQDSNFSIHAIFTHRFIIIERVLKTKSKALKIGGKQSTLGMQLKLAALRQIRIKIVCQFTSISKCVCRAHCKGSTLSK